MFLPLGQFKEMQPGRLEFHHSSRHPGRDLSSMWLVLDQIEVAVFAAETLWISYTNIEATAAANPKT